MIQVREMPGAHRHTRPMTPAPLFAADLLRKYDVPGPRYTSYPTAPHFGRHFDETMLREYIRWSNAEPIPRSLSLYLHVPYCFSPCFYCGCNRVITRDRSKGRQYVERLVREIAMVGPLFDRDREVVQLHFGGGTPNFLEMGELREVLAALAGNFRFDDSAQRDFSIELDPRYVPEGYAAACAELGFNRASLGVQDFDPEVQRAVNRLQSVEQTARVVDDCRAAGWRSINIDLIYGLPKQTVAGFERTLDTVLDIRPDRLAVYSYAHMPRLFKPQRQIARADLPSAEDKLRLLQLSIEKLTAAGYIYIGMDHFALPGDELAKAQAAGTLQRNFMGYTTHADCDLVGLGVSAVSHVGDSYSQNGRDLPAWETAIDQGRLPVWRGRHLDFDDVVRADLIQGLMCQGSVEIAEVERRHGIDFRAYFADALARLRPLVANGLVTADDRRIVATSRGRLLLRIIAMCFDRYLNESELHAAEPRFSRTI
jgi:oxygen-independent coproporphyrinogen III oxidase